MRHLFISSRKIAAVALIALAATGTSVSIAHAQTSVDFPDVSENHWAYQAVHELADKGLVKGYPDGKFLGDRALTRFEFATVVARLLDTIGDMKAGTTPTTGVTQDDLNKIQVLVDKFQPQLDAIQANVTKAQSDIDSLRQQVDDLRQDVKAAKSEADKALATANNSYGSGSNRKFQISGYIQGRYYSADSGDQMKFPNGTASKQGGYNGNYTEGGAGSSFNVRRARVKFAGVLSKNTKYGIQLDDGGATSAVTAREANFTYTFGDGSAKNVGLTAGLFANPFGYELPLSSAAILSPERPLAFNETGNGGPFNGQDYDRGVQAYWGPKTIKLTMALVNGTGLGTGTDTDRHVDQIYRAAYLSPNKVLGFGVSYYNGQVTKAGAAPAPAGKKELYGFDAQYVSPAGPFLQGEYMAGKYPIRTYFTDNFGTTKSDFLNGNKVKGYYVQGGWTWNGAGAHPLTAAASYDVFDRSDSGMVDSGSAYSDVNWGYGVLYNLDPQTRLRLWYTRPSKVAHASAIAEPDRVGLFTTELQVKF